MTQEIKFNAAQIADEPEQSRANFGEGYIDPRRRRFVYGPGAWRMEMAARDCNINAGCVPQGELVALRVKTFSHHRYLDTEMKTAPEADAVLENTPEQAVRNLTQNFADPGRDFGLRDLRMLAELDDFPAAMAFGAVHPPLAEVGAVCPKGQLVCASCRLAWLNSRQCELRLIEAVEQHLGDLQTLAGLRLALIDSCQAFLETARAIYVNLTAEVQQRGQLGRGLIGFSEGETHLANQLHETVPQAGLGGLDLQALMMGVGQVVGQTVAQTVAQTQGVAPLNAPPLTVEEVARISYEAGKRGAEDAILAAAETEEEEKEKEGEDEGETPAPPANAPDNRPMVAGFPADFPFVEALMAAGILTLADLQKRKPKEIQSLAGVGPTGWREIRAAYGSRNS